MRLLSISGYSCEGWTSDAPHCNKVGIPKENQTYKTKPEIALQMLKQDIERGVKFDRIGGDGLYGHNTELCNGIDSRGKLYVLDVHKDEKVFLAEPTFGIPDKKPGRRRKPTKRKANQTDLRLDTLLTQIKASQWKKETIRDTTKEKLNLHVYKTDVWAWDGVSDKDGR